MNSNNLNSNNSPPNREDELFASDIKSAFLNKSSPYAKGILYTVILFVLVFLVWAYFGSLEQVTVGEGKVIPSSQVKIIQSLDGGIVAAILVKEGDIVKKNQVLMRLDDTRYAADYRVGYAKYLALEAMIARLTAEAYGYPSIKFSAALQKNAPELVVRETRLFETRKEALVNELTVLNRNQQLAAQVVEMHAPLVAKGVVSKIDYVHAQEHLNETQTVILEKKDKFREDAWTELNDKKAELASLEEQLKSLNDKIVHATLLSPVQGVIKKLNVVTVGGTITPGMNIMEVVPLEDTLLVEAKVDPRDIAFIHVGQHAVVRVSAYDYTIYGDLKGIVEYISPDAIDETKTNVKQIGNYYLVNVRTQSNYLGNTQHKLPILPGMNATVQIITGSKTVLDYLLKPLIKAKEEALRER